MNHVTAQLLIIHIMLERPRIADFSMFTIDDFSYETAGTAFTAIEKAVADENLLVVKDQIDDQFMNDPAAMDLIEQADNHILGKKTWDQARDIVLSTNHRRKFKGVLAQMDHYADDLQFPARELVPELESMLYDVRDERLCKQTSIGQQVDDMLDYLDPKNAEDNMKEYCGFPAIDNTMPLRRGGLYVFAARPGHGKTAFMMSCLNRSSTLDKHGVYCCEMSSTDLLTRLAAQKIKIPFTKLDAEYMDSESLEAIATVMEPIRNSNLQLVSGKNMFIEDLVSWAKTIVKGGVKIIWVDYLQRIFTRKKFNIRRDAVAHVSTMLKSLAIDCNIPIVCLAQLNRDAQGIVPQITNLAECSIIENDADGILLLDRPGAYQLGVQVDRPYEIKVENERMKLQDYNKNYAAIKIDKHRHGPQALAYLQFNGPLMQFEELERERRQITI